MESNRLTWSQKKSSKFEKKTELWDTVEAPSEDGKMKV